jgi:hypothetical protein
MAFRAFFGLLFGGALPEDLLEALGLVRKASIPKPAPPKPEVKPEDGALQLLSLLQRESRILDFLMEDLGPFSDEQIGAAARDVQSNARGVLLRHFTPGPVIDAVEGSPVKPPSGGAAMAKFIGNVPATGQPSGGVLRHKGWRANSASLPKLGSRSDLMILAPAEIEVE